MLASLVRSIVENLVGRLKGATLAGNPVVFANVVEKRPAVTKRLIAGNILRPDRDYVAMTFGG